MNYLLWDALACAPLCLAIYVISLNVEHFMPYNKTRDAIMSSLAIAFWGFALVGCAFAFAGCISMAQNAS